MLLYSEVHIHTQLTLDNEHWTRTPKSLISFRDT